MISIGSVLEGPELRHSSIDEALAKAMEAAVESRDHFELGSAPSVNVVFYVPGSLGRPDWDLLRSGRFSRKDKLLMVQVAVPEDIVSSDSAVDFVINSLYGANAIALDEFGEKGMEYPLAEAEELVGKIRERLTGARAQG